MVVSDNGTALTTNAMLRWQEDRDIEWRCIAPGKPMQNGLVESFNGRVREHGLDENLSPSLRHACRMIAAWRDEHRHRPGRKRVVQLAESGDSNLRRQAIWRMSDEFRTSKTRKK